MNKTFKTLWNDVRRCFIVANEAQKSHGKPSKLLLLLLPPLSVQRLLRLLMLNADS